MNFDKITPLTRTKSTTYKERISTKVLDKYYTEQFLNEYFKLSKNDKPAIIIENK